MTNPCAQFYYTIQWQNTRAQYKKSVGGLCELCLKDGIVTAGAIVHHKIPVTPENMTDPNITLNWDNLMLLCRKHHAEVHENMYQRKRRYTVDEYGRVTARGE